MNGRSGYIKTYSFLTWAHLALTSFPPEIIESAMYLYRATKDPYLLEIGVDILEGIENGARTSCGYATVSREEDSC